jgi:mannitol-specific phosphotransferase system IIBC component
MGIIGFIGSMIMFVLMLPFIIAAGIAAGISHLLVVIGMKADQAATETLGETYTKPRNALGKLVVAIFVIAVVTWILSMAISGSSGRDCEYGRTGEQCSAF